MIVVLSILLLVCGWCIIGYKGVAEKEISKLYSVFGESNLKEYKKWTIGTWYYSDSSFVKIFAIIFLIIGIVCLFLQIKWYWVILCFLLSLQSSHIVVLVFKKNIQTIAPIAGLLFSLSLFLAYVIALF